MVNTLKSDCYAAKKVLDAEEKRGEIYARGDVFDYLRLLEEESSSKQMKTHAR